MNRRPRRRPWQVSLLGAALCLATLGLASAETATVAVAANFARTAATLASSFEQATGHQLRLTNGSSAKHAAQIRQGAPFDLFLSADQHKPRYLEQAGLVSGTPYTYALGRLVVWSASEPASGDIVALLTDDAVRRVAIANPALAPYGAAAQQTLRALGIEARLLDRLVFGDNVAQALQFAATGNAQYAIIAKAQWQTLPAAMTAFVWPVPETLHEPIVQDVVLLERGRDNPAARAFLCYLFSTSARQQVRADGYRTPRRDEGPAC